LLRRYPAESNEIDDLLSYPNFDVRAITRVAFTNYYPNDPRTDLDFAQDPKISLTLVGEEKDVIVREEELTRLIQSLQMRYPTIRVFPGPIGWSILMIITLALSTLTVFGLQQVVSTEIKGNIIVILISSIVLGALFGLVAIPTIIKAGRTVFPPANFGIGDGVKRFLRARAAQHFLFTVLVVGLLIAIVGAIAGAFVYDRLTSR
jgi:hypothetical protein